MPPLNISVLRRLPSSISFSAHKTDPLPGEQAGMFLVSGSLLQLWSQFCTP